MAACIMVFINEAIAIVSKKKSSREEFISNGLLR